MVHSGDTYSHFAKSSVSFDDIVLEGASGGIDSLVRYLNSRRQMFMRDGSQVSLRGEDPANFIRAIEVIDDALRLLEQIGEIDVSSALEEAASQMEEMAEKGASETADAKSPPHL